MTADNSVAPAAVNPEADKWIHAYVALRDQLKKIDSEHEDRRKEYVETMAQLSARLQNFLESSGVDSAKTKAGTVYSSVRYTASLADPEAFMRFVIANNKFELLDRRANATAVRDYVEENNQLPPGANLSAIKTIGVRRPGAK